MAKSKATWARWKWSRGLGRWHRLFADGDFTKTACDTPRKSGAHVAEQTATTPSDGPVCGICKSLDDLLQKNVDDTKVDAIATKTVELTGARPLTPVGMCLCGCAASQTDEARAVKAAQAAWDEAEALRKQDAFAAYLAGQ